MYNLESSSDENDSKKIGEEEAKEEKDGGVPSLSGRRDSVFVRDDEEEMDEYEKALNEYKISQYSFENIDPKNDSGLLSRLFFYWGYRIIQLARLTRLSLSNLGILTNNHTSTKYSKDIYQVWENYKHKKNALIKTVIRVNIFSITLIIIGSLLSCVINIYSLDLFNKFLNNYTLKIEEGNTDKEIEKIENLINISLLYLGSKLFLVFLERKLIEYQNEIGYRAGLQLDCLAYRKILNTSLTNEDNSTIADIVNYIQVDSFKLTTALIASPNVITIPFLIIGYSYMLFQYFKKSFLMGFCTLIIFVIINFCFQKQLKDTQDIHHKHKDETMKLIIDTFNHIKCIKVNGWDEEYLVKIQEAKEREIRSLGIRAIYSTFNQSCLWCAPVVISTVTIGLAQYFSGTLGIGNVFTCLRVFSKIDEPIRGLPGMLSNFFLTFVSLKRIEKYLNQDEYDQSYVVTNDKETKDQDIMIKIENGSFTWGKSLNINAIKNKSEDSTKQSRCIDGRAKSTHFSNKRKGNDEELGMHLLYSNDMDDANDSNNKSFTGENKSNDMNFEVVNYSENAPILTDINLTIKAGEFICIIGETGSGKTSLLECLLGSMIKVNNDTKIVMNGSISYVGQVPWISNDTLKNNVIFHFPFNKERYDKVIELCKLKQDLEALIGGDSTEIGENGINISGGQKSRISLARGIYSEKDIYIFDEPTSALDVRVGLSIIKKGIAGFLQGKTRILVTKSIEYAAFSDRVIYMKDGQITWEGKFEEIHQQPFAKSYHINQRNTQFGIESKAKLKLRLSTNPLDNTINSQRYSLAPDLQPKNEQIDVSTNEEEDLLTRKVFSKEKDLLSDGVFGKEKKNPNEQSVIYRTTKDEELKYGSIQKSVLKKALFYLGGFKLLLLLGFVVVQWQLSKSGGALWMIYWEDHQSPEYNLEYFIVYASLGVAGAIFVYIKSRFVSASVGVSSKNLHLDMVYHLVHAPLNNFHDITPKGQIINRLSRDINTIEDNFFQTYSSLVAFATSFAYGIIMCSFYQPFCLALLPMLGLTGAILANFYLNCSRDLVRLEGIARSPVLNTVNETCLGSNTIRAHKFNDVYINLFYKRLDELFKVRMCIIGTFQWFSLVLDLLSFSLEVFLIVFSLAFMKYYNSRLEVVALLLNYSTTLQDTISSFLFDISSFQNTLISMERCLKYSEIVKEAPFHMENDKNLKHWPEKGEIKFNKLTVRYRPGTKIRLNEISLTIRGGEKVGIVGRTGSGKSTIAFSIGRLVEALSGSIVIDGVDIKTVGLKKLRNSLNIISQDVSLLEGTLRYNIDPLGKYTDAEIKKAMQRLNFWYICEQSKEGLDQVVAESGMNFSMSEKQLIFATRALLNRKKILILDEFTSNLDYKMEDLTNRVLFEQFKDSTIIVIAHRIKTVMKCDKVLVLEQGRVKEFDDPKVLKNKKDSLFYKLYEKSFLDVGN